LSTLACLSLLALPELALLPHLAQGLIVAAKLLTS